LLEQGGVVAGSFLEVGDTFFFLFFLQNKRQEVSDF
jgi:hypothetical protein